MQCSVCILAYLPHGNVFGNLVFRRLRLTQCDFCWRVCVPLCVDILLIISFYAASRNGPCLFLLLQSFFLTPFLFYLNFSSLSQNILVFFFFHTQCSFTMRACTRGHHIHHARTRARTRLTRAALVTPALAGMQASPRYFTSIQAPTYRFAESVFSHAQSAPTKTTHCYKWFSQ